MASALQAARRIVVKVGSSLVTNEGRGVDAAAIDNWCRQLAALAAQGGLWLALMLSLVERLPVPAVVSGREATAHG